MALALLVAVAAVADSEEAETPRVEDRIVVTSNKQETALAEVPEAVSVIADEDLEALNITRLDDFNGLAPGLTISKNDGAGRVVTMRGVGWETAQNLATQPGVLLYVDGVYIANPLAFGIDLESVERVEVFRGPQGTEFGQSATGGAINLVTESPRLSRMAADLSLAVGSYDRLETRGSLNLPLNDRFAVRLSGHSLDRDGFSEIEGADLEDTSLDGYDLDDANNTSGRLVALWSPTSRLSIEVSAMAYDSDQHGAAQKHLDDPLADPRRLTQDYPSRFSLDTRRGSASLSWTLGDGAVLQSLTAVQELAKEQTVDGDRLVEDLVAVDLTGFGDANFDLLPVWDNDSQAFSQEVSVLGGGERVDWVAGLYYLEHTNDTFFVELIGPAPMEQFADQIADPTPTNLPPFTPPLEFVEDRTLTRWDGAAYGQLSIRVRPRLQLVAGGRWQNDRSRDRTTQFWFVDSEQRVEDSETTWRLAANLGLGDGHLLHAAVASGWKNGGLNPGALVGGAVDVPPTFEPEEVTTVEVGNRSTFGGGRGHASTTAFFNDYRSYQYLQEDPVPFSAGTGNIPEVSIFGVEAEAGWWVSDRLHLSGQLTTLDGEVDSHDLALDVVDFLDSGVRRFTDGAVAARADLRRDLAGNLPPKLPDLTSRLSLDWRRPTAGGEWNARLDAIYRGEFQYRVFNHPRVDTVPAYTTVSVFAGYSPREAPWRASVSVSNLFDRHGINSRFTNPFGLHTTSDELIPPREIVARVEFGFGGS